MSSILAIGAHPDDIEAGCFGTLMKHKRLGDEVCVVVTTKGGLPHRTWETILEEIKVAQAILGEEFKILDNPNGHYEMNWKTVSELDELIAQRKIDTIYSVWHGDSHQDHRNTFRNTIAAARKRQVRNLYCFELPDYSYRSEAVFTPKRYVDITEFLEDKVKAAAAYKSYYTENDLTALRGLARHRGGACGVQFAEAFEIIFEMWK